MSSAKGETSAGDQDLRADSHRLIRLASLAAAYVMAIIGSLHLAYELRWDFAVPMEWSLARLQQMLWVVPLKLFLLLALGQMRALVYYFGLPDLLRIATALGSAAAAMLLGWYFFNLQGHGVQIAPPRGVILTDFVLSLLALGGIRFSLRLYRERFAYVAPGVSERVAVIGAGDLGAALVHDALKRPSIGIRPVVCVDDDSRKFGARLHGVPVTGPIERIPELVSRHKVGRLIVTMPSASEQKLRTIVDLGRSAGVRTEIVPSWHQLANGEVRIDRIRPVQLEDLLGRRPVQLDTEAIAHLLRGRVVMVTGAGGSIGTELCRQILRNGASCLLLVDQAEPALFTVEQELLPKAAGVPILALVADVCDAERMRHLLATHRPALVFHAAAHKHVPMMETNPSEALKNNTIATHQLCRLASEAGVERFVLVSTDKAINPTSVMGASKRLAELAVQAAQECPGNRTRFQAVRFGNVLGSSGSVIPTFQRQIEEGGPVTVTHPEVTRYFMTIREAVGLVLQAAALGEGGEIFVLEMGEPVRILDIARQLIELSGFRPGVDIDIQFTGMRPGEKLHEEIQHTLEGCANTAHPQVRKLVAAPPSPAEVESMLADLAAAAHNPALSPDALRQEIRRHLPDYLSASAVESSKRLKA